MSEVTKLAGGQLIPPKTFYKEMESGRKFAVPDNEKLAESIGKFFTLPSQMRTIGRRKIRENYLKNWNPQQVIDKWIEVIELTNPELDWSAPKIQYAPILPEENISTEKFARHLIAFVLCEPERCGTWIESRLIRDLDMGLSPGGFGACYLNELSASIVSNPKLEKFDRAKALDHFIGLINVKNYWEEMRVASL